MRLIFSCDPALATEAQVALALRTLCGLSTAQIAAVLLTTESATATACADDAGDVVLLSDQDRSLWDLEQIVEGCALLDSSLCRTCGIAEPSQLQAAIAAEHARSPSYAGTNWREIIRLYDLLLSVAPSAAVQLNRAVAVAETNGAAAGLAALANVALSPRWPAVRGELLARQGRYAEAVEATAAALGGELTAPERRYRERRLAEWTARV